MWPATIFAVSRTHRVIGRMMLLTSSIITINAIKATGVPWGNRWITTYFVLFTHLNKMIFVHIKSDIDKFRSRWDERENTWENIATEFKSRINNITDIIIISVLFSDFFSEKLTSFFNLDIIVKRRVLLFDLFFHVFTLVNVRGIAVTIQDIFIIEDLGSNIENRFVIILCLFGLF